MTEPFSDASVQPPAPDPRKGQTVLEYVKAALQGGGSEAGGQLAAEDSAGQAGPIMGIATGGKPARPALLLMGLLLILIGQALIGTGGSLAGWAAIVFFALSTAAILSAYRHGSSVQQPAEPAPTWPVAPMRWIWLAAGIFLAILAYILIDGSEWDAAGTLAWATSIVCLLLGFGALRGSKTTAVSPRTPSLKKPLQVDRKFAAAALALIIIMLFFQFANLKTVPPEMISSQAEQYYSVSEILNGNFPIFFPRNVVSEPVSYYWAALWSKILFQTPSFSSLKFVFALAALVSIFYAFKLGELLFGRWEGLAAAGLMGVAFWPIVQSRALLGYGLVLPVLSPALYYQISGLRRGRPAELYAAGVLAGLGLMTNKLFWILPLFNLVTWIAWAFKQKNTERVSQALRTFFESGLLGVVTAIPLLRAAGLNLSGYLAPFLSRVSAVEVPLAGQPLLLFLRNWIRSLGVTHLASQSSWVEAIPSRAALDWMSAVLFVFGFNLLLARWLSRKDWQGLALLLAYPLFSVPSALALAFPAEVPLLSRSLGAALPVFLIAGFGAVSLIRIITAFLPSARRTAGIAASVLILLVIVAQNRQMLFNLYPDNYAASAWNTSEMGTVIRNFRRGYGPEARTYLIGYPYWADARVVAIEAGIPNENISLPSEEIGIAAVPGPQLYILHPDDSASLGRLQLAYPDGVQTTYQSIRPNKNFILYIITDG